VKIHEFQTKGLLAYHGIPVDSGVVVGCGDDVEALVSSLGSVENYIVKAQIHGGGRGKGRFVDGTGSGVQLAHSQVEVVPLVRRMLGNQLITKQTGPAGCPVHMVYVGSATNFCRELYLAIFLDRSAGMPVIMASSAGGAEVEEQSKNVFCEYVCPLAGLQPFQLRKLAFAMGFESAVTREFFMGILQNLYRLFDQRDASLIEINPLVEMADGRLLAIDGKAVFDDNALFRHPDIRALSDQRMEDSREIQASAHGVNYVALEGDVGCLTNGAGLAMATMDLLHANGLAAANFLDLGDNSGAEAVSVALEILFRDGGLRCLLVNTFGGAMCGDMVARCVAEIFAKRCIKIPLVVRMEGARAAEGLDLLRSGPGLKLFIAKDLRDIPQKIREATEAQ
jgi:succinyl-CoA synthetase beta subunit